MNDDSSSDTVRYVSTVEAADRVALSPDYIASLARRGKIVARQVGRQWYVNLQSLKSFLDAQNALKEKRSAALSKELRNIAERSAAPPRNAAGSTHQRPPTSLLPPEITERRQPTQILDKLIAAAITIALIAGVAAATSENFRADAAQAINAISAVASEHPLSQAAAVTASIKPAPAPVPLATSSPLSSTPELSSPETIVERITTQPIIEQVPGNEPLADANFVTQDELNQQLVQLTNWLAAKFTATSTPAPPQYVAADGNPDIPYAAANNISNLSNVTITNANLTASEIPALNYFPATNTVSISYGGTGISNTPGYGQLLLGNGSGGYSLTSTSSLGIAAGSSASSTLLADDNTFAGTNTFSSLLNVPNGLLSLASTTIGNGNQNAGLTINGGATTTGNAYFGGDVGIGTESPGATLDIDTGAASGDIWLGKNSSGCNALTFNGSSQSLGLCADGSNNLYEYAPYGGTVTFQPNGGADGWATFDTDGNLLFSGANGIGFSNDDGLGLSGASNNLYEYTPSGGSILFSPDAEADPGVSINGNGLGIGTTSPSASIAVAGASIFGSGATNTNVTIDGGGVYDGGSYDGLDSLLITTPDAFGPDINLDASQGAGGIGWVLVSAGTAGEFGGTQAGSFDLGNLNSLSAPFTILDNNNVGIGTENPNSLLDVSGGGYDTTGNPNVLFQSNDGVGTILKFANTYDGNSHDYDIGTAASDAVVPAGSFQIWDDTTDNPDLIISPSGNVGIGTASPAAPLDVNTGADSDTILTSGLYGAGYNYNILSLDGTTTNYTGISGGAADDPSLYLQSSAGGSIVLRPDNDSYGGTVQVDGWLSSDDLNVDQGALYMNGDEDRTGINTENTFADLTVMDNYWEQDSNGNIFAVASSTASDGSTGNTLLLVNRDGDVGIGTTTPNAPLDINAGGDNDVVMGNDGNGFGVLSFNDNTTDAGGEAIFGGASLDSSDLYFNTPGGSAKFNQSVLIGSGYALSSAPSNGVAVQGYVGIGTTTPIDELQVAGLANPIEASSTTAGLSAPQGIFVQGRYAYVESGTNNDLVIFDISNPAVPAEISSTAAGNGPQGIYVSGNYAYIINNNASPALLIYNIANPASPIKVSSIATGLSTPVSVYVQGRYAYVASQGNSSLDIFDVSNPANPVEVGTVSTGLSTPVSVYVQGRYAYVASEINSSLVVFDVSNPANPVEVGSTTSGLSNPTSVYVQGRYAYVASFSNSSLVVFDISNPALPAEVGSSSSGLSGPFSVYVSGRYAYLASRTNNALVVFDVSNPASPLEVGSSSSGLDHPQALYVQGRYAYVASQGNSSLVTFQIGGEYTQSLEAGTLQAGSLELDNNLQALDGEFNGGLTVASNLNVGGSFSLTASTFNATTSGSENYSIFSLNTASSTSPLVNVLYNGSVGIGTTSPAAKLDIDTGADNDVLFEQSDLYPSYNMLSLNGATSSANNIGFVGGANGDGNLYVDAQSGMEFDINNGAETPLYLSNNGAATVGTDWASSNLAGPTNGLLVEGNVGIGTTTPSSLLTVWGSATASSTVAFNVVNSASTTLFSVFDGGNAELSGSLSQSSDERLKTNIQSLDASSSLSLIDELNPVTFNWIDPEKGTTPQLGFIAQQVLPLFPNLVSTTSPTSLTPDGTLSLNYIGLISPIVSAIQEISSELTSLENTIAGFAESFTTHQLTYTGATGTETDTQTLCLTDGPNDAAPVCITKAQLAALLSAANVADSAGSVTLSVDSNPSPGGGATDTPPQIQINGDNPAIVQVGATYNDLGATVTGPQADLNLGIQTFVNGAPMSPVQIDTSQAATDTIDYVVTDQTGLTSTSTRTVIVEAPFIVASADASSTAATTTDATTTTQ